VPPAPVHGVLAAEHNYRPKIFDGISVMVNEPIKSLFANDIHRRIEEVIKVDQTRDDILRDEINEYV